MSVPGIYVSSRCAQSEPAKGLCKKLNKSCAARKLEPPNLQLRYALEISRVSQVQHAMLDLENMSNKMSSLLAPNMRLPESRRAARQPMFEPQNLKLQSLPCVLFIKLLKVLITSGLTSCLGFGQDDLCGELV